MGPSAFATGCWIAATGAERDVPRPVLSGHDSGVSC